MVVLHKTDKNMHLKKKKGGIYIGLFVKKFIIQLYIRYSKYTHAVSIYSTHLANIQHSAAPRAVYARWVLYMDTAFVYLLYLIYIDTINTFLLNSYNIIT